MKTERESERGNRAWINMVGGGGSVCMEAESDNNNLQFLSCVIKAYIGYI